MVGAPGLGVLPKFTCVWPKVFTGFTLFLPRKFYQIYLVVDLLIDKLASPGYMGKHWV